MPAAASQDRLYIAGDHPRLGQWRADGLPLTPLGGGEHHGQIDLPRTQMIEYKITRGTWETVERSLSGASIANRRLTADSGTLQLITVERWADHENPSRTADPSSRRLRRHVLASRNLGDREVIVYLPPGYDKSDRRYPVLYMQDGQNLFEPGIGFSGTHWRAAETADRLIIQGRIEPLIIVGVHNSPDRLDEYAPIHDASVGAGGRADQYVDFVVDELKPMIDHAYRTRPGRPHTAIGGSSLGAIASLHACMRTPHVFGKCAALSPSLWWGNHGMTGHFLRGTDWLRSLQLWVDMGAAEECAVDEPRGHAITDARAMARAIRQVHARRHGGFHFEEVEGGIHHEHAWAARFDRVLAFLFPS